MDTGSFQSAPRGDDLLRTVNLFRNAIANLVEKLPAIGITDATFVREGMTKTGAEGDFQSPLDPMAESLLVNFLGQALPQVFPGRPVAVWGEERSYGGLPTPTGLVILIDPFDGTVNIPTGGQPFATALALVWKHPDRRLTPLVSVVYDHLNHRWWSATLDSQTLFNGTPCRTSDLSLKRGIMYGAFTVRKTQQGKIIRAVHKEVAHLAASYQAISCSTVALGHIACGSAQALVHSHPKLDDAGAHTLLVRQAGGVVSYRRSGILIAAASQSTYDVLEQALKGLSAPDQGWTLWWPP